MNEYLVNLWGSGPRYDIGRRCAIRGSVREVEEVYANESTHVQSLTSRPGGRISPFFFFRDSKYIIGRVRGKCLDFEGERRGAPPLDRRSGHGRSDMREVKNVTLRFAGGDEVPTENDGRVQG